MNPRLLTLNGTLPVENNPAGVSDEITDAETLVIGPEQTLAIIDTSTNEIDITLPEPIPGRAVRFLASAAGNIANLLPHDGEVVTTATLVGSDDGTSQFWHVEYTGETSGWIVLYRDTVAP